MKLFISYASEDKEGCVRPLAKMFMDSGIQVWFDEFELKLGDSIREKIDHGLIECDYGIVIVSKHYINKTWTKRELDGLFVKEKQTLKAIIPVWHDISLEEVKKFSPILASIVSISTDIGLFRVYEEIVRSINYERKTDPPSKNDLNDYYIYISSEKLSMLNQKDVNKSNMYAALNQFRQSFNKGEINNDGFINCKMDLAWGIVDFGVCDDDFRIVMFYNKENKLLLSGSVGHIIGTGGATYKYPSRYFGYSGSHLPAIVHFLRNNEIDNNKKGLKRRLFGGQEEKLNSLIEKHTKHFPKQNMSFVVRILGKIDGITVASPIFVSLSPHGSINLNNTIIEHELVDPLEIEKAHQRAIREHQIHETNKQLDTLFSRPSLDSFISALAIYKRFNERSIISRDYSIFLDADGVLDYCTSNLNLVPIDWMTLVSKAQSVGNVKAQTDVITSVLATNHIGTVIDCLFYIGKEHINQSRLLVLEKLCSSDHNIRKWAAYALGEIGVADDMLTLSKIRDSDSSIWVREEALKALDKLKLKNQT